MQILNESEVIEKINNKQVFSAITSDGALTIVINQYVPYIATAIHAGDKINPSLKDKYKIKKSQRYYEEDPFTDTFINGLDISLVVNDSRYYYDLNRQLKESIYDIAWGEVVYKKPLSNYIKQKIYQKHQSYYQILNVLITQLEALFNQCYLFDIHSYNYKRIQDIETPVFNIGTHYINKKQHAKVLASFHQLLKRIDLPNIDTTVKKDCVFHGRGYQAEFVSKNFSKTLVFPLEVKKIYMDELTGESYPLVIEAISKGLQLAIKTFIAKQNQNRHQWSIKSSKQSDKTIVHQIDKKLYQLSKKIDVLYYVNPINYEVEKRKFFQKNQIYQPQFKYRQLKIDPFDFREKLYRLPISTIQSPTLRQLYREVVDSIALDVDLITSIAKESFFYNSLRIYGEPNINDIKNAKFLLYAPPIKGVGQSQIIDTDDVISAFKCAIESYQIPFNIKISDSVIAKAMVDNTKKTLLINRKTKLTQTELNALIHHEIGVHALTTVNAEMQPLSILKLGLPHNTHTQEGLAIYGEYLSGNLTLLRLQELALRVIAVDHMIRHQDFIKTYHFLLSAYALENEFCFRLVARVYRGGGFSKDFLYLNGLREVIKNHTDEDFMLLFAGKTSLKYLKLLKRLIDEGWLVRPKYLPTSYQDDKTEHYQSMIIDYLIQSVK
ncbi:flavohemoglobin expression-modulating QEGLA motif protein [Thiotrichales bacterium 19S3-11]|nr:flavohemoglobin expression-modulating QEGLA motif protein [Thiotrichales bacterium 19S3-11]